MNECPVGLFSKEVDCKLGMCPLYQGECVATASCRAQEFGLIEPQSMSNRDETMTENLFKSNAETLEHINAVRGLLMQMIQELDRRGQKHDASKLQSPEQEIFASTYGKLDQTVYGTPEYQKLLDDVKPALDHHYANNRHHPQHWPNGINDMTLIDLVEMLCDWKASTQRVKDGNIRKSIEHNASRFEISPQLVRIFQNTVREMFP